MRNSQQSRRKAEVNMIPEAIALDIETIPNEAVIEFLPEPEVALGNMKDAEKIEEKKKEAKRKQVETMALDPLTGRICSFAMYGQRKEEQFYRVVADTSEAEEITLIKNLFENLSLSQKVEGKIIVTWNGNQFDFPFIYKRAAILKAELPKDHYSIFYWLRRYSTFPHCDLMQAWNGFQYTDKRSNLDFIGKVFTGAGKTPRDYSEYLGLIKGKEGAKIGLDNLCDAELTYNLYQKIAPYLL
jgi:DNA polymerase elongation subunit (family B)